MSRVLILPLAAVLLGVAACGDSHPVTATVTIDAKSDAGHYKPGDGKIDLDGDSVRIVAGGTDDVARVGSDGGLRIGDKPVETSAAATTALRQYYADAVAVENHGLAIGVAGAKFGVATVKDVFHGLLTGTAEEAGKRADEGAKALVAKVKALCDRVDSMYKAQQTAAGEAPAFKPYAVISQRQVDDCYSDHDDEDHAGDETPDAAEPAEAPAAPRSAS